MLLTAFLLRGRRTAFVERGIPPLVLIQTFRYSEACGSLYSCSSRFWLRLKEMLPRAGLGSPRLFSVLEPIEQLAGNQSSGSFSGR